MNKLTKAFCYTILQLDRIPRYGRLYLYIPIEERDETSSPFGPAEWRYQKNGLWGFNLLHRFGLLFSYLDETNPNLDE